MTTIITHENARHEIVTNRSQRTISLVILVDGREVHRYILGEQACAGLEAELADARKSLPPEPPKDARE